MTFIRASRFSLSPPRKGVPGQSLLIDLPSRLSVPLSFINGLSKIFHKRQNIHVLTRQRNRPSQFILIVENSDGPSRPSRISQVTLNRDAPLSQLFSPSSSPWEFSLLNARSRLIDHSAWTVYRCTRYHDSFPLLEFYSESFGITCSMSVSRISFVWGYSREKWSCRILRHNRKRTLAEKKFFEICELKIYQLNSNSIQSAHKIIKGKE